MALIRLPLFASWFAVLAITAVATSANADANKPRPSFNCLKATTGTEKTICGDVSLSAVDGRLSLVWKTLLGAFADDRQIRRLKRDQADWLVARDKCGDNRTCIEQAYRDRLDRLDGSAAYPFAGVYVKKGTGSFAAYPADGGYLVSIQTADPESGRWICELNRTATPTDKELRISVGKRTFAAFLQDDKTLSVPESPESAEAESQACGLNGSFSFSFERVSVAIHLAPWWRE